MKRYVPIIIGIVALLIVIFIGSGRMNGKRAEHVKESVKTSFTGSVTRMFEGDHTLMYGFNLPEGATTSIEKDGALVKVVTSDTQERIASIYYSYEGGRGYSVGDYINNVIVPNVKVVEDLGTSTIGSYEWHMVGSKWTTWYVTQAHGSEGTSSEPWLIVAEINNSVKDGALPILESFTESQ